MYLLERQAAGSYRREGIKLFIPPKSRYYFEKIQFFLGKKQTTDPRCSKAVDLLPDTKLPNKLPVLLYPVAFK